MKITRDTLELRSVTYTVEKRGHPVAKLILQYNEHLSVEEFDLVVDLVNQVLSE